MQGSFEKKVQEKLDELRLTPTPPVWEKIEQQLEPERGRRRGLVWLFFLLALLTAGGWWMTTQTGLGRRIPVADAAPTMTGHAPRKPQQNIATEKKTNTGETKPLAPKTVAAKKENSIGAAIASANPEKQRAEENVVARKNILLSGHLPNAGKRENNAVQNNNPINEEAPATQEQPAVKNAQPASTTDSVAQSNSIEPKNETPPAAADSAKKKAAAASKKWSNKILFAAGWSSVVSPAFSGSAAALDYYSGGSIGIGNNRFYQASKLTKGFSFSIGYAKEKALAERLTFSVGLQYAYYSVRQSVGMYKLLDTAVRFQNAAVNLTGYYANAFSSSARLDNYVSYVSHFHVAELPIGLRYKVLKRLPLWAAAGASYGRLLSSNALTFDPASGVYYANKQNNRKNYLNLSAALQYTVVRKNGWALSAGPAIQYNAVSLQKVGGNGQHLLFAGLKTGIEF